MYSSSPTISATTLMHFQLQSITKCALVTMPVRINFYSGSFSTVIYTTDQNAIPGCRHRRNRREAANLAPSGGAADPAASVPRSPRRESPVGWPSIAVAGSHPAGRRGITRLAYGQSTCPPILAQTADRWPPATADRSLLPQTAAVHRPQSMELLSIEHWHWQTVYCL